MAKEEEIRSAIEGLERQTLADALTMMLSEDALPSKAVAGMNRPDLSNFAQAILYLKKNYDFPELDLFSTEADLVYVSAGDRRILLTDRMNVPEQMPAFDRHTVHTTDNADSVQQGTSKGEKTPKEDDSGRFSHLEL